MALHYYLHTPQKNVCLLWSQIFASTLDSDKDLLSFINCFLIEVEANDNISRIAKIDQCKVFLLIHFFYLLYFLYHFE